MTIEEFLNAELTPEEFAAQALEFFQAARNDVEDTRRVANLADAVVNDVAAAMNAQVAAITKAYREENATILEHQKQSRQRANAAEETLKTLMARYYSATKELGKPVATIEKGFTVAYKDLSSVEMQIVDPEKAMQFARENPAFLTFNLDAILQHFSAVPIDQRPEWIATKVTEDYKLTPKIPTSLGAV